MLKKLGKKFGTSDDVNSTGTDGNNNHNYANTPAQQHSVSQLTQTGVSATRSATADTLSGKSVKPNTYVVNTSNNTKTIVRTKSGIAAAQRTRDSASGDESSGSSAAVAGSAADDSSNENTQQNNNINNNTSASNSTSAKAISGITSQNGGSTVSGSAGLNSVSSNGVAGGSGTGLQPLTKSDLLKPIATLNDTPLSARTQLLIHKLRLCCITFEWSVVDDNPNSKDNKARECKRQQLLELVEYIGKCGNAGKQVYTDSVLSELMQMVQINLFRALPARQTESVANKTGGGEGTDKQHEMDS